MSWTWNVILSFSNEEMWEEGVEDVLESCSALDNINEWLEADKVHNYGPLTDLAPCAAGNGSGMSANIYGGGFKHFDMEAFTKVVARQQWHDRASVQLFIQGEDAGKFTLMELAAEALKPE